MVGYGIRDIMRGAYSPWISWLFGVIATYGDRVNVDGTGCVCACGSLFGLCH